MSDDILNRPKAFVGWNTIIGEGDAKEAADDLLVTVRLVPSDGAEHSQKYITAPVTLTVYNAKGKVIGARRLDNLLTSSTGVVVLPFWLNDITCAGELRIVARHAGEQKPGRLTFVCGE